MRPKDLLNLLLRYALFLLGIVALILVLADFDGLSYVLYLAAIMLLFLAYINWADLSYFLSHGKSRKNRRRKARSTSSDD